MSAGAGGERAGGGEAPRHGRVELPRVRIPASGQLVQLGAEPLRGRPITRRIGEDHVLGLGLVGAEFRGSGLELAPRLEDSSRTGERPRDQKRCGLRLVVRPLLAQRLQVPKRVRVTLALDERARCAEADLGVLGERSLQAGLVVVRRRLRLARRPVAPALLERLCCPDCRGRLTPSPHGVHCATCATDFVSEYGVPRLDPTRLPEGAECERACVERLCGGDPRRRRGVRRIMRRLRRNERPASRLRRAIWGLVDAVQRRRG